MTRNESKRLETQVGFIKKNTVVCVVCMLVVDTNVDKVLDDKLEYCLCEIKKTIFLNEALIIFNLCNTDI